MLNKDLSLEKLSKIRKNSFVFCKNNNFKYLVLGRFNRGYGKEIKMICLHNGMNRWLNEFDKRLFYRKTKGD